MASVRDGGLVRSIGILYEAGASGGLADVQLLERVADGGESAASAFEAIVARHGPMVLSVCRRALDDPHDAQDAFQATFLVLARRARSIRKGDALASWLFGVARRVCDRARTAAARRRLHERRAAERTATAEPDDDRLDYAALHEEVARLPERYRLPVVLCYLEGLTYEAAADRLRCPPGTLSIRLSRARDRLRSRLLRRGLTASAGLLAAPSVTSAAVPDGLIESSARLAMQCLAGDDVAPAAVAALTRGVLNAMRTKSLQVTSACLAALATGAGLLAWGTLGNTDEPRVGAAPAAKRAEPGPANDFNSLQGIWDEVDPGRAGGGITSRRWEVIGPMLETRSTRDGHEAERDACELRLNAHAAPRELDMIYRSTLLGEPREAVVRCIYKIEGDTLTICGLAGFDRPRPTNFRAAGTTTIVLRRRVERPPAAALAVDPPAGDLAKLQGTWAEVDPASVNKEVISSTWTIAGTRLTNRTKRVNGSESEHVSEVRLDERSTPPGIDLVQRSRDAGGEHENVHRCLYKIEGDTLTLCGPLDMSAPRPSAFGAEGTVTLVLRRAGKPEAEAKAKPVAPALVRGDLARLQGSWVAEAVGPEGKADLTMTFAGDVAASTSAGPSGTTRLNLKVTLDESARPPAIETTTIGPKPTRLIGIYRIERETFTVHMTTPDKPRPTDFAADEADPHALIVFRRKSGH